MKIVVKTLCQALLLGALWIPAFGRGTSVAAAAVTLSPAASSAPNQNHAVAPLNGDLPVRFNHITAEQGLSSLEVWSVLRDNRGFLWFGTLDGLNRYDGYEMRVFRHDRQDPRSLSENTIRTLYQDRAGTFWIGTWTGGLDRYERDTESFTHFRHDPTDPNSLSSDSVFTILEDRAGRLWLGTRGGGLDRFDPQTQTFSHYRHDPANPQSLSHDNVFALQEDRDGTLWVGTDGGLDRFDPNTGIFTPFQHDPANPASLNNQLVRSLHLDDDGMLWIGTFGGGLDRLDLNQVRIEEKQFPPFVHYRHDPNDAQSLGDDNVFVIHRDVNGRLWVGTLNGGLNLLDEKTGSFQRFQTNDQTPQGFQATRVLSVVEDERSVWFATYSGVYMLDLQPKPFRTLAHNPGDTNTLAGTEIDSVYQDPQNILWVSTTHSGLNKVDRASHTVIHYRADANRPDSLGLDDVSDIAPSRDGGLWLALYGGGLDKFDPETGVFTHYRHNPDDANSVSSNLVISVYEDSAGIVWVGTWDAGLDRFDPVAKVFTHFPHIPTDPNSLSDNAVMAIQADRSGALWISTLAGVNRMEPSTGALTRYSLNSPDQALPEAVAVSSVYEDRRGAIWVAGYGDGLYQLNPTGQVLRHYSKGDGLPSESVFAVLEDDRGLLWISTSHGISRFDPSTETFRNFDQRDGLPGDSFKQAVMFQGRNGEKFFGGKEGLVSFFPDQIQDSAAVPPVVITNLLLANKPALIGGDSALLRSILETHDLTLSYQDRVISFGFAALNYIAPQKNRYRYMLEGFDQGWTEVGSDRRLVTYTNLDPGKYVFRVLGSNDDGIWNETGAALALAITPPWWETTWFRVSATLLMVGLVAGGFVGQRGRAAIQQRKLEAMVVTRTRELQDARTQINTLFDSSPLGITVATMEGKILGANRAMQRITGYSEDDLLRSNVETFYAHPEQRAIVLEQLRTKGFVSDYGIQLRRHDGSVYFASLNLSQLELAGQEVLLGTVDDVTEQVEAREALATLHHISYDLASISDLHTLLDHALQHLHRIIDFQRAALMLMEDGEESLTIYVYTSPALPPEFTVHHFIFSGRTFLQNALKGREATYIPDIQASETLQSELDSIAPEWWAAALKASRSWLGLPLRAGERAIGLLIVLHDEAKHYATSDIELAHTFANQLAVAVDNIHLNEQTGRTAAADERSRIARELHDSVTQTLFTASVLAEATPRIWNRDRDIARQNMEKLSVLIRGALAEMRSLLLELRTDASPDQSPNQLLNTLAEATRARSNMAVSISVEGDRELPADVIMTLYRIAQEALNNVVKHAEATRVDIMLLNQPDRVTLHIRDDGRGFEPQVILAGHLGISIMAERAQKIGADLQIQNQPGRGTAVSVTWPAPTGRTNHD